MKSVTIKDKLSMLDLSSCRFTSIRPTTARPSNATAIDVNGRRCQLIYICIYKFNEIVEAFSDRNHMSKLTYSNSLRSVDARIMQHCKTGAKIVNSSWNAFPKPRPWSQCNVNVSLPNILCVVEKMVEIEIS